jgi:hypothetical protein
VLLSAVGVDSDVVAWSVGGAVLLALTEAFGRRPFVRVGRVEVVVRNFGSEFRIACTDIERIDLRRLPLGQSTVIELKVRGRKDAVPVVAWIDADYEAIASELRPLCPSLSGRTRRFRSWKQDP